MLSKSQNASSSPKVGYEVVHTTSGRIRIRLSQLALTPGYYRRLKKLLESLEFVSGVRINAAVQSIVIHYEQSALSADSLEEKLATAIEQAADNDFLTPTLLQSLEEPAGSDSAESVSPEISQLNRSKPLKADRARESGVVNVQPVPGAIRKEVGKLPDVPGSCSGNKDKQFQIVFSLKKAAARLNRLGKQKLVVNYTQMSRQIQAIHQAGGKILSISAIT